MTRWLVCLEWSHLKYRGFAVNDILFVSLWVRGSHTRKLDESVLRSGETHKMQGNHLTTWPLIDRDMPQVSYFLNRKKNGLWVKTQVENH